MIRAILVLVALFVSMVFLDKATAATRLNKDQCEIFGDMALTTRALAMEGLSKNQTKSVLSRIYIVAGGQVEKIRDGLVNAAYVSIDPAWMFSTKFRYACHSGAIDSVIGIEI